MSDTSFTILAVLGCAFFLGLYFFVHHHLSLIIDRLARKAGGTDDISAWQPHARPTAAILLALLAFAPALRWLGSTWPARRDLILYGVYFSSLVALTLFLSAYSRRFQRVAFRLQPVPSNVSHRFTFGITFFLVLCGVFTYLYFHLS